MRMKLLSLLHHCQLPGREICMITAESTSPVAPPSLRRAEVAVDGRGGVGIGGRGEDGEERGLQPHDGACQREGRTNSSCRAFFCSVENGTANCFAACQLTFTAQSTDEQPLCERDKRRPTHDTQRAAQAHHNNTRSV